MFVGLRQAPPRRPHRAARPGVRGRAGGAGLAAAGRGRAGSHVRPADGDRARLAGARPRRSTPRAGSSSGTPPRSASSAGRATRSSGRGSRRRSRRPRNGRRAPSQVRRTIGGWVVNGDRIRRLTRDGTEIWVEIYAGPMIDAEGTDDRLRRPDRRRDRADGARGAAAPGGQDGGDRPAVGRDRARLQQHAHGDPRQRRAAPGRPRPGARRGPPGGGRRDPPGGRPRREPDPAAAGIRAAGRARAARPRPDRGDPGVRADARDA